MTLKRLCKVKGIAVEPILKSEMKWGSVALEATLKSERNWGRVHARVYECACVCACVLWLGLVPQRIQPGAAPWTEAFAGPGVFCADKARQFVYRAPAGDKRCGRNKVRVSVCARVRVCRRACVRARVCALKRLWKVKGMSCDEMILKRL